MALEDGPSEADATPGSLLGDGSADGPASHPFKGNASLRTCHRPGESSYPAPVPPFVFISGRVLRVDRFAGVPFLVKPFDLEHLVWTVSASLAGTLEVGVLDWGVSVDDVAGCGVHTVQGEADGLIARVAVLVRGPYPHSRNGR